MKRYCPAFTRRQGLLCREKQKSSKNEAERAQWAKEAQELASKGVALQRKKES
jgi:hypothetical protein